MFYSTTVQLKYHPHYHRINNNFKIEVNKKIIGLEKKETY